MADRIGPLRVQSGIAVFIVHAAQIRSRSHAPEVAYVRSFATARRAEVCIDWLAVVVNQHLTFSRANCVGDSTLELTADRANESLTVRRRAKIVAVGCVAS